MPTTPSLATNRSRFGQPRACWCPVAEMSVDFRGHPGPALVGPVTSRRTRPYESTPAGSSARRSPEEDPKLTVSWSRAVSHDPITASTCSLVSTDRSLRRVLGRVLQQGQSCRKPPPFGTMRRPNQGEWAPVKMYQLVDYGPGVNFNEEPFEQ